MPVYAVFMQPAQGFPRPRYAVPLETAGFRAGLVGPGVALTAGVSSSGTASTLWYSVGATFA